MTTLHESLARLERIGTDIEAHTAELAKLHTQRDAWASLAHRLGASLQDIADAAGVSKQRIHQTINR